MEGDLLRSTEGANYLAMFGGRLFVPNAIGKNTAIEHAAFDLGMSEMAVLSNGVGDVCEGQGAVGQRDESVVDIFDIGVVLDALELFDFRIVHLKEDNLVLRLSWSGHLTSLIA